MKKAVIITPFDNYSYQVRIKYVEKYLLERGFDVTILSSDFDHRNKVTYTAKRNNLELLHVPKYQKNLSFARINSHRVFAKKALERLKQLAPQLIYCSAPPNFLFKYTSQYKRKHKDIKLIYEVGDLWPEALPLKNIIKYLALPVLQVWIALRNNNIKYADAIIYECQLFKDTVCKSHPGVMSQVVYLGKDDYYKGKFILNVLPEQPLRFAYVGSINNIIDINLIVEILKTAKSYTQVKLVVIGGGENAESLFKLCDDAEIDYENHGIVYDSTLKHNILNTCHFGLNIMKYGIAVGATMKSLEYFHEGLILINNISADTESIIHNYNCGINLRKGELNKIDAFLKNLNITTIENMRLNSRKAYEELFETGAIRKQLLALFDNI